MNEGMLLYENEQNEWVLFTDNKLLNWTFVPDLVYSFLGHFKNVILLDFCNKSNL